MYRSPIFVSASLLVLLATVTLDAQEAEKRAEKRAESGLFERLDADGDGFVTEQEAGEEHGRLFKRLLRTADKNQDQKLSPAEFATGTTTPDRPKDSVGNPGGDRRPQGMRAEDVFKRFDSNKDGKLAKDELPQPLRQAMNRLDTNQDGFVDRAELVRARTQGAGNADRYARIFGQMDSNRDGRVALDEIAERQRPAFERMMQKVGAKDGLTLAQFAEAMGAFRGPNGRPTDRTNPNAPPSDRPNSPTTIRVGALMRTLDKDNNGELSAAEIAAATESLRTLDRDKDGSLSRRELFAAAFAAARGNRGSDRRPNDARPGAPRGGLDLRALEPQNIFSADKDGDRKLSKSEAPDFMADDFADADSDGDGKLEGRELRTVIGKVVQKLRNGTPEEVEKLRGQMRRFVQSID